ncbi:MAG: response regulator [Desulfobacteraceae bacterium]|nr:response regulator [Desulfobacteraceae bacterium]
MNFKKRITNFFELPHPSGENKIDYFRQRLLFYLLLGFAIFGFLAYLPSIYFSFVLKFHGIAFLDTLVLGMVFLLLFNKKISFFYKALGLLSIFYILGLGLLIVLGPTGAGFLWLLMFSVMTGVLLGVSASLISLGINLITLIVLTLLIQTRGLLWMETQPNAWAIWIVVGVNFICINAVAASSVAFLIDKIARMLQDEKQGRIKLESEIKSRIQAEKDNKELLRLLHHSQKMEALGTLASGVAHDFNNILSAILGYAELSLLDMDNTHPAHKNLEHICQASERAKSIVHQILTFSRQAPSNKEACDLNQIILECITFFKIGIPNTIQVTANIPDTPLSVHVDKTKIYQVIMNLLTNSMHAIELDYDKENRIISLGAQLFSIEPDTYESMVLEPGDYIKLTVEDTGCGIQKKEIHKIFEPYFTTKETGKGTGMGLSIAHGIIRAHGGEIMVSSVPGKGSCFMIYLPCHGPLKNMVKPPKKEIDLKGSETILFIDDEKELVEIQIQFLEKFGYRVIGFTDPLEAKYQFEKDPDFFDLIITDNKMPDMTGDRLTAEIKKINPRIPVILCSGFVDSADDSLFNAVLTKPVAGRVLAENIRRVVDKS